MEQRDGAERPVRVIVLMPVFRDWEVASLVCAHLDDAVRTVPNTRFSVLLVDDGTPEGSRGWTPFETKHLESIDVVYLRRNMGHQRAIAIGLCHLADGSWNGATHDRCDAVLIMDADGEDRPTSAMTLVERFRSQPDYIHFAARRRRLDRLLFRSGYAAYRLLHRALTGVPVRVGNFSIVPAPYLTRLTSMSEVWNHYAGAVFKSQLPYTQTPIDRGPRLGGRSRMNVPALVAHGIAGMATFYDVVATRILLASVCGVALSVLWLMGTLLLWIGFGIAVPGWTTLTVGVLAIVVLQIGSMSFGLVFSLMVSKTLATVVPIRDYRFFLDHTSRLDQGV